MVQTELLRILHEKHEKGVTTTKGHDLGSSEKTMRKGLFKESMQQNLQEIRWLKDAIKRGRVQQ